MSLEDVVKVPIVNENDGKLLEQMFFFNGKEGSFLVGDWIEFADGFWEVTRRTWKGQEMSTLQITVRPVGREV